MAEKYIRVEDIRKVCNPTKDHDVPMLKLVRCKDCKHYYADPWGWGNCVFEFNVSRRTKTNDFCSWGEDDGV